MIKGLAQKLNRGHSTVLSHLQLPRKRTKLGKYITHNLTEAECPTRIYLCMIVNASHYFRLVTSDGKLIFYKRMK